MAGVPQQAEDLRSILMNKDDLLHCFFIFLWSKGPDGLGVQGVRIPDTVILNHSRILEYYFTSKEGSVKRKSRGNLVTSHLLEQLEKHSRKCQQSGIVASILGRDASAPSGMSNTPFTFEELRPVLVEGTIGSGTMQFFIEPKKEGAAAHNACIGVQWTPNVTYMEKRTNVHPIASPSSAVSNSDKTTLEDGSTSVRISQTISPRVSAEIDRMCRAIAQHILVVFKARILNMGLEFKVDTKEQTWLTHCYALKLADPNTPTKILYSLQLKEGQESSLRRGVGDARGGDATESSSSVISPTPRQADGGLSSRASSTEPSAASGVRQRSVPFSGVGNKGRHSKAHHAQPQLKLCRCVVCGTQERVQPSLVARHNLLFPLSLLSFFSTHPPGSIFEDESKIEMPSEIPDYVLMMYEHEHADIDPLQQRSQEDDRGQRQQRRPMSPSDELDEVGHVNGGGRKASLLRTRPLSLEEYAVIRKDPAWLNQQLYCCDECTEELRCVVEALEIGSDGKIRVPGNPNEAIGGDAHRPTRTERLGTFAKPTAAQQARLRESGRNSTEPPSASIGSSHVSQQRQKKPMEDVSPYAKDLTSEFRRSVAGRTSRSTSRNERSGGGGPSSGNTTTSRKPPTQSHNSNGSAAQNGEAVRGSGANTPTTLPPLAPSRKASSGNIRQ